MPRRGQPLIVDANVLIDYANSDPTVLALAGRHLGPIYLPTPLLAEVDQLAESDCASLGLRLVEPTLEQLLDAGEGRGRLSFTDRLCLILARDNGWGFVTNDGALRQACVAAEVEVIWGLELMLQLVEIGELEGSAAIAKASAIRASNPAHITLKILARFEERIMALGQKLKNSRGGAHPLVSHSRRRD